MQLREFVLRGEQKRSTRLWVARVAILIVAALMPHSFSYQEEVNLKVGSLFWDYDRFLGGWTIHADPLLAIGMIIVTIPSIFFSCKLDALPRDREAVSLGVILSTFTIAAAVLFRLPGPPIAVWVMLPYSILAMFGLIIVPMVRREISRVSDNLIQENTYAIQNRMLLVWLVALLSPHSVYFLGRPTSFFMMALPYELGLDIGIDGTLSSTIWLLPFITATMTLLNPLVLLLPAFNFAFAYYVTQYCLLAKENARNRVVLLAFLPILVVVFIPSAWLMGGVLIPFPLLQVSGLLLMSCRRQR